ncbi:MAG: heme-binding protein [Verrucomicrobiota bacterium]
MILPIVLLAGAALILGGCQVTRSGYESAPYKVVRADGKFEVRDYPPLTVVETSMASTGNNANGSFGRLFAFITGGNQSKQKISMTTPVLMSGSDSNRTMAFVMPSKLKPGEVPVPADGSVSVRQLAAGRFAVMRFNGSRSTKRETESLEHLKTWMATQNLVPIPPPVYGYFDPPWTLGFLRRNEVMLRTEQAR